MATTDKTAQPNLFSLALFEYLCQDGCLHISKNQICPLVIILFTVVDYTIFFGSNEFRTYDFIPFPEQEILYPSIFLNQKRPILKDSNSQICLFCIFAWIEELNEIEAI